MLPGANENWKKRQARENAGDQDAIYLIFVPDWSWGWRKVLKPIKNAGNRSPSAGKSQMTNSKLALVLHLIGCVGSSSFSLDQSRGETKQNQWDLGLLSTLIWRKKTYRRKITLLTFFVLILFVRTSKLGCFLESMELTLRNFVTSTLESVISLCKVPRWRFLSSQVVSLKIFGCIFLALNFYPMPFVLYFWYRIKQN